MLIMGWSVYDYYARTHGLRVRPTGYVEERLPRSVLLTLMAHKA